MNNKYTNLLLFILTFISYKTFGQVYEIDAYNGQTVTTCKGAFQGSIGQPYNCLSGIGNGYRNNENYTVTFCSGTPGRPIRVSFITWDIEAGYDFLYVYDGNSTAAPLLATISGSSDIFTSGDLYFTSTGTCLTFRFTSDGSTRYCGWDAIIGCQPTGCNGNPPAGDNCADAPQICDLDAYCGNTTGWYTSDATDIGSTGSGLFCGSIENNSWLKFVPSTTSASFEFTSSNCLFSGSGIQAMILRSSNCNTFTAVSNCVNQNTGTGTFTLSTNTPLTPGTPYYLMIDGFGGNLCDYTVRNLTGLQRITLNSNAPICEGNTATVSANNALTGTTFSWTPTATIIGSTTGSSITVNPTTTTKYYLNATQPNGCTLFTDSITVIVNPKKASTRNDVICEGSSITVGTHTYTQTGNYLDTLRTSSGCDSVVTTNLTVKPKSTTNLSETICANQSVTVGSQTFNQTGNYTVVLTGANGCDSTVNLALTVNATSTTNLQETFCEGGSITIGSNTYTQTGSYTVTLQSALGCDSTINLSLTVNPNKTTSLTQSICEGESFSVGSSTYTESGNYSDTLQTSLGCDSIVNLSLTKNLKKITNLTQGICTGQSITVGTQTFNSTGSYSVVLQSSAGCDSTVNLNLTVSDSIVNNITQTICTGGSVTAGGQTFSATGNYTVNLQSSAGCDSIIHLDLTVVDAPVIDVTADPIIVKAGEPIQLGVTASGTLSYSWTPAGQLNDPLAQNPIGTISTPTWFVVTASNDNQCTSTDSVFVDLELDICNIFIPNAFSPNGDGVNDVFKVRSSGLKSMTLIITNRWGITVFETKDINGAWDGIYKGQPAETGVYGYYFTGECVQGDKKTLKGSITLLR